MRTWLRPGRPVRRQGFTAWASLTILALVAAGAWLWVLTMPATLSAAGPRQGATHLGAAAPARHAARGPARRPAVRATGDLPLGVYVGPTERSTAVALDQELDGHVEYLLDFLNGTSWATITQPSWIAAVWRGASFRMVLGVPMLPETGGTLAEGAAGDFDGEFTLLADRLVSDGLGTAVLMIGAQPDDAGQPWYVETGAAAHDYVRYWDRIQAAMAAVPGAHFVFEWDAGDAGTSPLSPATMYPGNAAVDVVATDAFDRLDTSRPTSTRWRSLLEQRYGPAWMASFAEAHGKPMAIAMSGVVALGQRGGGDDARFVRGLLSWASAARVEMCVLWDSGSWAITGGDYPAADAALVRAADRSPAAADPAGADPAAGTTRGPRAGREAGPEAADGGPSS